MTEELVKEILLGFVMGIWTVVGALLVAYLTIKIRNEANKSWEETGLK